MEDYETDEDENEQNDWYGINYGLTDLVLGKSNGVLTVVSHPMERSSENDLWFEGSVQSGPDQTWIPLSLNPLPTSLSENPINMFVSYIANTLTFKPLRLTRDCSIL
jgi:hypothetical protein